MLYLFKNTRLCYLEYKHSGTFFKFFFLKLSQSVAGDERIFWRFFVSSYSSDLLSLAYYALQPVLQPLFHTFTWMKMPKLVCVQLFNTWKLEPLRQKKKRCQYTHQYFTSLRRKKGNCQLTEIPVRPCWWFMELRALLCRSLKVRAVAAEMEQAAACSLRCETWINSGSQATALPTRHFHDLHGNVCPTQLWYFRLWLLTHSCNPVNCRVC